MQAIILCAGKSTRAYPLTLTLPKPLLRVANKPILYYTLASLIGLVDEAILIVNYKKGMIIDYFGATFKDIKLRYVEQKEQLGTGNALLHAKNYVNGRFFVIMGDDIYSKSDIKRCLKFQYAVVGRYVDNPSNFGVFIIRDGNVIDLIEKPTQFVSNIANTGLYLLDEGIFDLIKELKTSPRGEYELTTAVMCLAKKYRVKCVLTNKWYSIAYPWDLFVADKVIRNKKNFIGKNTLIHGKIIDSSIGDNCKITGSVKNSIVMDNTFIDNSTLEDSVIGSNVYFNGDVIPKENLTKRINNMNVVVKRLGTIIGDNSRLVDVTIKEGAMIWPNKIIKNRIISDDII